MSTKCSFLSASIFLQLFCMRSVCISRRLHREKAQRPASFFWALWLFCIKFKMSPLFRKALVMLPALFVSTSGRLVWTQRWRRSWCWPSGRMSDKVTKREKPVCVFVFVYVVHPHPSCSVSLHVRRDRGSFIILMLIFQTSYEAKHPPFDVKKS